MMPVISPRPTIHLCLVDGTVHGALFHLLLCLYSLYVYLYLYLFLRILVFNYKYRQKF